MTIKKNTKYFILILTSLTLFSCTTYRPIFDPNQKYKSVGEKRAKEDADICMMQADQYLKDSKKRRMIKEAGRKAALGSIVGGAFSLIGGGNMKSLATSAAVGAGVGAAFGGGGVAAEDKLSPDAIKQRFVSRCLGDQGYEIIGWE